MRAESKSASASFSALPPPLLTRAQSVGFVNARAGAGSASAKVEELAGDAALTMRVVHVLARLGLGQHAWRFVNQGLLTVADIKPLSAGALAQRGFAC